MNDGIHNIYVDAVRALWPEGPAPVLLHHRAPRNGTLSFRLIPNAERARLMVPADNGAAAGNAMLRFSSAVGLRERASRIGMAGALRSGGFRLLSHRIDVATRSGSLVDALGHDLGEHLDVSMSLGPARANRKPVLQLFDRAGASVAFAKVGYSPAVRPHVLAEHHALRMLEEVGLPSDLEVPRVLGFREWSGMPTLVMSALRTPGLARRLPEHAIPVREMELLSRRFDEGSSTLGEVPLWKRLAAQVGQVCDPGHRAHLEAATDRLEQLAGTTAIPVGAWHGDWTPWNMAWRAGRLQLWDWERFETGVPLGLDRVHYAVNSAFLTVGIGREAVQHGVRVAGLDRAAPGSVGHTVVGVYLTAILLRYLGDELPAEGAVTRRVAALIDALSAWIT